MNGLRVVPLAPTYWEGFVELFDACASGCFCRYWHFDGTKNDWLLRLAERPDRNASEQRAALEAGDDSARGVVALDGELVIGWMKLAPRHVLGKLVTLRVYRSLALPADDGVLSIACVLVRPTHRRRGVAAALLDGAIALAGASGATAVEAYPHVGVDHVPSDEELWMGPASLFARRGFTNLGGIDAYPRLRLDLEASTVGGDG